MSFKVKKKKKKVNEGRGLEAHKARGVEMQVKWVASMEHKKTSWGWEVGGEPGGGY